jgi:hypothetical protein
MFYYIVLQKASTTLRGSCIYSLPTATTASGTCSIKNLYIVDLEENPKFYSYPPLEIPHIDK